MLVPDIAVSIIIAFSFFTSIPMPKLEWTPRRMRLVPFMMPIVGVVNGGLSYGLYLLLSSLKLSPLLCAALMCFYYVLFTGGLHLDGLMDYADAYFSRRDRERKLEIMKDSAVGAFAVITLVFFVLVKTAVFTELFTRQFRSGILLAVIPVLSRLLQSSMLFLFPPAKAESLTRMYGRLDKWASIYHLLLLCTIGTALIYFTGTKSLVLIAVALMYYIVFYFSVKRQFGGITGDLLGAFLELSELFMLAALLLV